MVREGFLEIDCFISKYILSDPALVVVRLVKLKGFVGLGSGCNIL